MASCIALFAVAVLLAAAAVVAPHSASAGPPAEPWESSAASGLLPVAPAPALAQPQSLPGLPVSGLDLPYRQR